MSDDATPRLSLPYLAAAQAQKHVTLNEALSRLDGLVQTAAESRTTAAQPAAPDDGAIYIMPADPTGADWAGMAEGAVMRFEAGAWAELPVSAGHLAYVKDDEALVVFDGAGWAELVSDLQNVPLVGVNAAADTTNRLAVSSAAVLFNHEGAGAQVKVNKAAASDTASHLFQTGFSGRAEFGLTGSDDFEVKVSPDGAAWHPVMSADRNTGKATFARSALRPSEVTVFTAGGTYDVPAWARRLRVVCIGGGGGGGSGCAGTSASNRGGGAGGGGGGRAEDEFDAAELGASLTITIGAGGAGGTPVTGTNNGVAGGNGGATSVQDGATYLLQAGGGAGGGGGAPSTQSGASGGIGTTIGNSGGNGAAAASGGHGADTTCANGPGGGGGGGGLLAAGTPTAGGFGGYGYRIGYSSRRAAAGAAASPGGPGGAGGDKAWERGCGGGGGGGGGLSTADAGQGGAGGSPGGGGGGGGSTRETLNSGAGGAGARGEVWIIAIG